MRKDDYTFPFDFYKLLRFEIKRFRYIGFEEGLDLFEYLLMVCLVSQKRTCIVASVSSALRLDWSASDG